MNVPDVNWLPTLIPEEKFYGFLPSEIRGVWTCRRCGTVARENEICSYCSSFPLMNMVNKAKAAWLDRDEADWLLPLNQRLKIYYRSINVQASAE